MWSRPPIVVGPFPWPVSIPLPCCCPEGIDLPYTTGNSFITRAVWLLSKFLDAIDWTDRHKMELLSIGHSELFSPCQSSYVSMFNSVHLVLWKGCLWASCLTRANWLEFLPETISHQGFIFQQELQSLSIVNYFPWFCLLVLNIQFLT